MKEEGGNVVKLNRSRKMMTLLDTKFRLTIVPAAAVKRGELVLFIIIGRKGYVGGACN